MYRLKWRGLKIEFSEINNSCTKNALGELYEHPTKLLDISDSSCIIPTLLIEVLENAILDQPFLCMLKPFFSLFAACFLSYMFRSYSKTKFARQKQCQIP